MTDFTDKTATAIRSGKSKVAYPSARKSSATPLPTRFA
jgi:hypothetical protein